jgi:hypothetical protein
LWVVLEEAVLRRHVGGAATMRDQLSALLAATESPRVDVQVLPFTYGEHTLIAAPLTLLHLSDRRSFAYFESRHGGHLIEEQTEVKQHQRAYDLLRANALSPHESAVMIKSAMEGFASCEHRTD